MKKLNIPLSENTRTKDQKLKVKELKLAEIQRKKSIDESQGKQITHKNYSVYYVLKAIQEYMSEGYYSVASSLEKRSDYAPVIKKFINYYLNTKNVSVSCDSFLTFVESFLRGSELENVPVLSTIHKMKGSEADRVFILDYPCFPYKFNGMSDEQLQQEINLQYVAITRAKKELYLALQTPENDDDADKVQQFLNQMRTIFKEDYDYLSVQPNE